MNHFAVAPDMGGGTRHIEMGRELVRRGWQVTIAASDFNLHRREYLRRRHAGERDAVQEVVDGVTFEWLWAAPYEHNDLRRVWNWVSFGRSLRRLRLGAHPPDLVIGSTPHLFAARAARGIARRLWVPFLLEVRDLWPESLEVGGRWKGPGYYAMLGVARSLYRTADGIIVLAEGVGDYLEARGVARERIAYVPNGVDISRYVVESRHNGHRSFRLVYAGAHGPANGLDTVLDAATRLREERGIEFLLVGDGPARQTLRTEAVRRGLTNVVFADPVPKTEMPALLAGCDAGLMVLRDLPLFAFGVSPNKLFDYWGASLPVVCNVPGDVARCVREAGGGIQAENASGAALADAVRRLVALPPEERRALGARGRSWVTRERDRPLLAARLDHVLRRFARGPA